MKDLFHGSVYDINEIDVEKERDIKILVKDFMLHR